jgi:hypothetical protein
VVPELHLRASGEVEKLQRNDCLTQNDPFFGGRSVVLYSIGLSVDGATNPQRGYRNFTNYRLRKLLAANGQRTYSRGRPTNGSQVHLLSAISHDTAVVLAQREIAAKTYEIPQLAPLLADLDLADVVVTADALHTQRETARHLVDDRGAHHCLRSKGTSHTCWLLPAVAVRPGRRLHPRARDVRPWARTHRRAHHPRRSRRRRFRDQLPPRRPGLPGASRRRRTGRPAGHQGDRALNYQPDR